MRVSVNITPDEEGYTGRECPSCEKYFKIKTGTGIPKFTDCYCPYCKCFGEQDAFWTKQQIEYAKSVVINQISSDLIKKMKKLERQPKKTNFFSIGITVKGNPTPIAYYTEKELEEKVTCSNCALAYTIYGAFGYCPDCGIHNSKQIVLANFEVINKMLLLAKTENKVIKEKLIENALEDCISAFDGFAREHCSKLYQKLSFQNLSLVKDKLLAEQNVDISENLQAGQWDFVVLQFQKRHLLAHKMGVVDSDFVKNTKANPCLMGRKVEITEVEVKDLIKCLSQIVDNLANNIIRS